MESKCSTDIAAIEAAETLLRYVDGYADRGDLELAAMRYRRGKNSPPIDIADSRERARKLYCEMCRAISTGDEDFVRRYSRHTDRIIRDHYAHEREYARRCR